MTILTFLGGYPEATLAQVRALIDRGGLRAYLESKYEWPGHALGAVELSKLAHEMKKRSMRKAPPLTKVVFDPKLHVLHNALGLHTTVPRTQGAKTKVKREIRVAKVFQDAPLPFVEMILAHELAHFKHAEHDADFYDLADHIVPGYQQLEFDLRLYLTLLELEPASGPTATRQS